MCRFALDNIKVGQWSNAVSWTTLSVSLVVYHKVQKLLLSKTNELPWKGEIQPSIYQNIRTKDSINWFREKANRMVRCLVDTCSWSRWDSTKKAIKVHWLISSQASWKAERVRKPTNWRLSYYLLSSLVEFRWSVRWLDDREWKRIQFRAWKR